MFKDKASRIKSIAEELATLLKITRLLPLIEVSSDTCKLHTLRKNLEKLFLILLQI